MNSFLALTTALRIPHLLIGLAVGVLSSPTLRLTRAHESPTTTPHAASAEASVNPPAGWKWDRPVPEHAEQRDGAIELRTESGKIWAGEGNRNRLMTAEPVETGDTVTAEIELLDAVGKWEQCGLLLHQHDDAFVKLVVEHIDGMHYVVMAWERPNGRRVLAQIEIPQPRAQLKLEVGEDSVSGYWRLDESASWQRASESDFPGDGEHRFGIFTQDGDSDRPRWARVRDLRLEQ